MRTYGFLQKLHEREKRTEKKANLLAFQWARTSRKIPQFSAYLSLCLHTFWLPFSHLPLQYLPLNSLPCPPFVDISPGSFFSLGSYSCFAQLFVVGAY